MDDQKTKFGEQLAKMVLWGSASASAAIYANEEGNQFGNYLLYVSAVIRAGFLVLMCTQQPRPPPTAHSIRPSQLQVTAQRQSMTSAMGLSASGVWRSRASQVQDAQCLQVPDARNTTIASDPTMTSRLDNRVERCAQCVLELQFVYYILCGFITLCDLWRHYETHLHDLPIEESTFVGHLWNAVDGLCFFFSFFFVIREMQNAEVRGLWESYVVVEHLYSVIVNGSMFALAAVSLCNGREYGPIDYIWFSLSMAGGTIEPIRFGLARLSADTPGEGPTTEMRSFQGSS